MLGPRLFFYGLFVAAFCVAVSHDAAAGDYVWARSQWGSSPVGWRTSSFSNGYGGYYVPRNSYGNNHESQQPFKNPNGVVIPAGESNCPAPAAAQTTQGQPLAKPWQLFKLHSHR